MMDLLEFVNTAPIEDLLKLTGLTPALVEKITAARPFSSLNDLIDQKIMTEKKFAAFSTANSAHSQEKTTDLQPVTEQNLSDQPDAVDSDSPHAEKPSRKNVWGKVITWLVLLLLLAGGVFAAIKWGLPYMYEKYVKPVENNAAEITDLASQQSAEVTRLNEEITLLQERITVLEQRADAVDIRLKAHDDSLAKLAEMQTMLEDQLATQKSDLLSEINQQITLTRAVDLVSRSRLYLSESNFGLAKTDLETSRNLLFSLLDVLPTDQVNGLKMVISRIDMALENLPAYPVVAVYDVDTAWQLLIDGLPNVPAQAVTPVVFPSTQSATPETSQTASPEATATVTTTP